MGFDSYSWEMYKRLPEGIATIQMFEKANDDFSELDIAFKYNPRLDFFCNNEKQRKHINSFCEDIWCYNICEFPDEERPNDLQAAQEKFEDVITRRIVIDDFTVLQHGDYATKLAYMTWISFLMYYYAPEYFFPYLFLFRYYDLTKIADRFGIELPPIPKKPDYKGRCMYYWELCKVFYGFRKENDLSPAELCAFLYDFAPHYTKETVSKQLPEPSQAWFIGGKIDPEALTTRTFWQANPETKRGDILIHYETSPLSAITKIWRAETNGIIDPFFHYYGNVYLTNAIDIPSITLKELKEDNYFSAHPFVKKSFQGVSGWSISSRDYTELLRLIRAKQFDTKQLPQIYAPDLSYNQNIASEADVEQILLNPLLASMGWEEGKDFKRQIGIKAGRGHRIYPDYVLHYIDEKNNEQARVLIEAKKEMRNNQEIEAAFTQAKSYANILQANVIVLCDRLRLIVYERNTSFDRHRFNTYYWSELTNPDKFKELKQILT